MGRTPLASLRHPMDAPEEPQLGAWGLREGLGEKHMAGSEDLEYGVSGAHVFCKPKGHLPLSLSLEGNTRSRIPHTPEPASSAAAQPGAQGGVCVERTPLGILCAIRTPCRPRKSWRNR